MGIDCTAQSAARLCAAVNGRGAPVLGDPGREHPRNAVAGNELRIFLGCHELDSDFGSGADDSTNCK